MPGEQLLQTDEPGRSEKVPAEHRRHVEDLMTEYEPGEQLKHTADVFAPSTREYVPGWHPLHTEEPGRSANVPEEHSRHVEELMTEYAPGVQFKQTTEAFAPSA